MINLGISRLPQDWEYVAWIDSDIDFVNPHWVEDTIHELQHHDVVQLFVDSIDLGPEHEVMNTAKSFAYCYKHNVPSPKFNKKLNYSYYSTTTRNGIYWHPGYAWAATKAAINVLGGLFEVAIAGAGDHHMAASLIGKGALSVPDTCTDDYKHAVAMWEKRALRLHKNIGYVKGTIYHFWHGKKINRRYAERWDILKNYKPSHDVYRDWQGCLTFHKGEDELRDMLRNYFQSRNEDSIDL
jgi:hypothetical protein